MFIQARPLAVVTGVSSGTGYELARCCAANGFDLIVVADGPAVAEAAGKLSKAGVAVEPVDAAI